MNSSKPYLLRALYEWIVDNGCTPHLLVRVDFPGVRVPAGSAEDDRIVLNLAPGAVRQLQIGAERISFSARFSGQPFAVDVPVLAVAGIYARENGQGMSFEVSLPAPDEPPPASGPARPGLRVVK